MTSTPTRRSGVETPADPSVDQAMAEVDWAATPLGAPPTWPASLHTMVRVLLGSRFSMWMAWGDELTFLCNDAYAQDTLGDKYPWALGRPASEVWAEIWPDIGPRIERVLATGDATWDEDLLLFLERRGFREESYHTFSYSPLYDGDEVVGMLCVVSEETERVVGERRMRTLRDLAADVAAATSEDDLTRSVVACFGQNPVDLPFTITALVDETAEHGLRVVGPPPTADGAPPVAVWSLDGLGIGDHRMVDLPGRYVPPPGPWGEPPERALVVALGEAGQDQPSGYLIAGLNPHRPHDDGYIGFLTLAAGQLGAALSNIRAFEAERRRSEALAEIDRAKTTFFTNISHEFRTPLTLLLGPLADLVGTPRPGLDPEDRDRLELAHRNGLRLLKLVNALLDFARIEGGHLTASVRPVDLGDLTSGIAGMFRSAVEDGGLDLVVDCEPLPALVDPEMWELIVTNLVANAFKHTFEGTIRVGLTGEDRSVVLQVADTGTGIPADELPRLFDRFHRVEGATARSHEGSGVGLSLVQELVGLHDGDITVESRVGEGTAFRVAIPLRRPPEGVLPTSTPSSRRTAHVAELEQWQDGGAEDHGGSSGGRVVVVVDDNADMRSYISRLLRERFVVHTAPDGEAALELMRTVRPDLVISDVMMPKLGGLELVERLRADPALADVPTILLSARAGAEASTEGLAVGADDYLVKPFSSDELLGRVSARLLAGADRRRDRELALLGARLQDEHDAPGVAAACHRAAATLLGTTQCAVATVDGEEVRLSISPPAGHGLDQRYATLPPTADTPLLQALHDGTVFVAEDTETYDRRFPHLAADHRLAGLGALLTRPVDDSVGTRVGALAVAWDHDRGLDPWTVETTAMIGALAGRALERIAFVAKERAIAEAVQQQLLDVDARFGTAVVAATYRSGDPDMLVGGDWYDAFALEEGTVGLAVGDVVGHGLPAALVMGQLRSALAVTASIGLEPTDAILRLDAFAERVDGARCTTAAYATIAAEVPAEGAVLTWCAAGHPPPIVVDGDRAELLWAGRRPPLGVPTAKVMAPGVADLAPTSLVILYTDGLVERRGESLDVGLERLRAAVEHNRHLPVHLLCDRLVEESAPPGTTTDDTVVLVARVAGTRPDLFVDILPADLAELAASRSRLRSWLLDVRSVDPTGADGILLAVGEAVANAVEHGSRREGHVVTVEVAVTDGGFLAAVSDAGDWSGDNSLSVRDGRGRGLGIMDALADIDIRRTPLGTTVLLDLPA